MQYLTFSLRMVGLRLVLDVFGLMALSMLLGADSRGIIFSAILLTANLALMYSSAWNLGKADARSYSSHTPYAAKGLVLGLCFSVCSIILLCTIPYTAWGSFAFRSYVSPYYFFFRSVEIGTMGAPYYLCILADILLCGIAYYAGTRHISLSDGFHKNILYQKKQK